MPGPDDGCSGDVGEAVADVLKPSLTNGRIKAPGDGAKSPTPLMSEYIKGLG